jgi:hypothetical protein
MLPKKDPVSFEGNETSPQRAEAERTGKDGHLANDPCSVLRGAGELPRNDNTEDLHRLIRPNTNLRNLLIRSSCPLHSGCPY